MTQPIPRDAIYRRRVFDAEVIELRREHRCWRNVEVRTSRYLNNIVEQDHRAITRRCASMAGLKSSTNAAVTIAGIELAHRIRKRQFMLRRTYRRLGKWSLKKERAIALA